MVLTPGTRLHHFEIVSALGAGGMGEVYRARDPKFGLDLAIVSRLEGRPDLVR